MNYHKIDICNMDNGDGLRVVLWVSGCSHYCKGCFNPQTWDINSGDLFGDEQVDLITYALSQDWCTGLTLTGGDPMFPQNRELIYHLCIDLKNKYPTKTIWLYTGYTLEELNLLNDTTVNGILKNIDVLVDGQFIENCKSPDKHWVGSSNQRVLCKDNKGEWCV